MERTTAPLMVLGTFSADLSMASLSLLHELKGETRHLYNNIIAKVLFGSVNEVKLVLLS